MGCQLQLDTMPSSTTAAGILDGGPSDTTTGTARVLRRTKLTGAEPGNAGNSGSPREGWGGVVGRGSPVRVAN